VTHATTDDEFVRNDAWAITGSGTGGAVTDTLRRRHPTTADRAGEPPEAATSGPWWRTPPVDGLGLVVWVLTFVVMTGVIAGLGLLLVHELGGVRSFDDEVARWFAHHRTDTWDHITWVGSFIADASVKIPVTIVLCGLFVFL
jgi:hypothetical protein